MVRVQLTIGQLAQSVGVPTSTIRYYEREGLLRPAGRNRHRYRYYDESSVERLRMIRAAQQIGLRLADIADLLRLIRGGNDCERFTGLAERRLDEIRETMADLKRLHDALADALRTCREDERCGPSCAVLDDLTKTVVSK